HGVLAAAVDDVCLRDAAAYRAQARLHLGDHAGGQRGQHDLEVARADLRDEAGGVGPGRVQPLDVGEHDELGGSERDGERRGGGVRIDVEHLGRLGGVDGDGGDDGDA